VYARWLVLAAPDAARVRATRVFATSPDGVPLEYTTDWILVGDSTLRILDEACTALTSSRDPQIRASFPCDPG
jgi:hypothetical protein